MNDKVIESIIFTASFNALYNLNRVESRNETNHILNCLEMYEENITKEEKIEKEVKVEVNRIESFLSEIMILEDSNNNFNDVGCNIADRIETSLLDCVNSFGDIYEVIIQFLTIKDFLSLCTTCKSIWEGSAKERRMQYLDFVIKTPVKAAESNEFGLLKRYHRRGMTFDSDVLEAAAINRNKEMVKWLLRNGVVSKGEVLDYAAADADMVFCVYLYKRGIKITKTAMNFAAYCGHLDVLKWLHSYSDVGCTTAAVDGAAKNGHDHVVEWLLENRSEGGTWRAMHAAAKRDNLELMKKLYEYGIRFRKSVVSIAANNGNMEVVQWLYKKGAKINDNVLGGPAYNGDLNMIQLLFKLYDPCIVDMSLDIAAENGHLEIVKVLVRNGALLTSRSLYFAAKYDYFEIVDFLYDSGTRLYEYEKKKLMKKASPQMLAVVDKQNTI